MAIWTSAGSRSRLTRRLRSAMFLVCSHMVAIDCIGAVVLNVLELNTDVCLHETKTKKCTQRSEV